MKNLRKLLTCLFFVLTLHITLYTLHSYASVPHLLNYQGRLTDSSGAPLNGSYNLTFRIYDAESAGNLLWEETQTGVVIQKGIFSILLGSVTNLNIPFDKPYWLEIKVGNEVMSPRQQITSAGYAVRAETADNALQAQNANTVANVGVSATPTANRLLPLDNNAKLPATALKIYDSGWSGPVGPNETKTFNHNLGTTEVLVTTMFSVNSDGSGVTTLGPQFWEYPIGNTPETIMYALSTTTVSFRTSEHGIATFINGNGVKQEQAIGYMRIIMLAVE